MPIVMPNPARPTPYPDDDNVPYNTPAPLPSPRDQPYYYPDRPGEQIPVPAPKDPEPLPTFPDRPLTFGEPGAPQQGPFRRISFTEHDQPPTEDVPPVPGYVPPPGYQRDISTGDYLPPGTDWLRRQTMQRQASRMGYPQSAIDAAEQQYPILRRYRDQFKTLYHPRGAHTHSDVLPPGEVGPGYSKRRFNFDISDTQAGPDLVAGEQIIHGIRTMDPQLRDMYAQFEKSVRSNPAQMAEMHRRYDAIKGKDEMGTGYRENRDFEPWFTESWLPQFFGAGFWTNDEDLQRMFTPEQFEMWKRAKEYITGKPYSGFNPPPPDYRDPTRG